jgi:mono/diheme cytochrome c family protein
MTTFWKLSLGVLAVSAFLSVDAYAAEKDPLASRVPADQLAAAKATKNPRPGDAKSIANGKAIFEGKGICFTCHGMGGKGDGDAGKALDPSPRNMTNSAWHAAKTDGEMAWVIKNGSPGTGMIAYSPAIISEDEVWDVINYERTFKGKK